MKTIYRVAATELRTLFYSPIAWFLMIVFLIQCGYVYFSALQGYVGTQEAGGMGLQYMKAVTEGVFLNTSGLFGQVMRQLYLYIPLLTMGLISRETSSGTIKLLYSSPIHVHVIVFGKFLAMMIYCLILLAIVGIFIISGLFHIQFPETGMLMTAMLGFYLLLCAYSAIGLFMSSLTTYQVVAAICTFVMIGILSYIGTLWQGIALVRNITYFLSISGRTEKMLAGLVTTKDVIYFIVIVYIFLGLTIYRLKAGMESKTAMVRAARYIGVIVSALLIGYISSIPRFIGYYDATSNKTRTLTPNAQKILTELGDEPLEVTAYSNLLGRQWYLSNPETYNQNLARWEPYLRFKQNIELKTICYYDSTYDTPYMMQGHQGKTLKQMAQQNARSKDIKLTGIKTPEEIRKIIDLRPEMNRFVMQLKYKGRTTYLRVFDDIQVWPSETEVSAAMKRLMQQNLPKIAFLTGDLERDIYKLGDRDYTTVTNQKNFRFSLINQGFDVDTVSLETQDIPADISTLVVADPKITLSPVTMAKLKQYIDHGGNLLITGEPNKQEVLNPLLEQLGVQLTPGIIIQESKDFSPDLATPMVTLFAARFSKMLVKSVADSQKVSMPGAAGLSYTTGGDFMVHPLLMTDAKSTWNRKQKLDMDVAISANASGDASSAAHGGGPDEKPSPAGAVTFSAADGDVRGPIPLALSLTRNINGKEQRIVVAGDGDFMSNSELQHNNMRTANFYFNTALFSWLSYGEFPIDTSRPDTKDNRVNVTTEGIGMLKIAYLWILPGLLLAFGSILLIRRKRK